MRLSVLMPNYNNGPYLKEAIDSVLNQTYKDFQFLIVDDGSTDDSIDIIQNYSDSRIRLIKREVNGGIVEALNDGLDKIDTEYFVRMDADDISLPERFEKLVQFMDQHPEIGVCSSDLKLFDVNSKQNNLKGEIWQGETNPQMNQAKLIFRHAIGHPTSIFRTDILKKNRIRYTKDFPYAEDFTLFYALKDLTLISCISEVLYHYRVVPTSNTNQNRDTFKQRYFSGIKMVFGDLDLEINDKNLQLHYDLGFSKTANYLPKEYLKWKELLLSKNKQHHIFPQKELEIHLNQCWDKMFFRRFAFYFNKGLKAILISNNKWKKMVYFIKVQVKKLFSN